MGARAAVCAWWCIVGVAPHGTLLESLQSDDFVPYLGYRGPLRVVGRVGPVLTERFTQSFGYALEGVDPRCGGGPGGAPRSCGLELAVGVSCGKRCGGSLFGGPVADDPWISVSYRSFAARAGAVAVAAGSLDIETGLPHVDVEDRPFLVRDYDGARVGCATLRSMAPLGVGAFQRAFGYDGPLNITGRVGPVVTEHAVVSATRLSYEVRGIEPECASRARPAEDRPDSCGLAVHAGTHCLGDPGRRLFATDADPWARVRYGTEGNATVATGLRQPHFEGRAVILRDRAGAPAACGVLRLTPALEATRFSRLGGYGGPAKRLEGRVGPVVTDNHEPVQRLAFSFTGADARCAGAAGPGALSCGIRLHAGESCAAVGGLFHESSDARGRPIARDPWAEARYAADADGTAAGALALKIGRTQPEIAGRAVVVYDYAGDAASCGVLEAVATVVAMGGDGTLIYGAAAPDLSDLPPELQEKGPF